MVVAAVAALGARTPGAAEAVVPTVAAAGHLEVPCRHGHRRSIAAVRWCAAAAPSGATSASRADSPGRAASWAARDFTVRTTRSVRDSVSASDCGRVIRCHIRITRTTGTATATRIPIRLIHTRTATRRRRTVARRRRPAIPASRIRRRPHRRILATARRARIIRRSSPEPSVGVQQGGQSVAPGGVSFEITPDTAAVFVDGTYVGTAGTFGPKSQPLGLVPGRHTIEIRGIGLSRRCDSMRTSRRARSRRTKARCSATKRSTVASTISRSSSSESPDAK